MSSDLAVPTTISSAIAAATAIALGARAVRVWVDDPTARVLTAGGSFGVTSDEEAALLDATTIPYGTGIPGRIASSRTPEFIRDAHDDPRWVNRRFIERLRLHGYAGLPLIADDGAPVGVLSVMFGSARMFGADDRRKAFDLARVAANAVRTERAHEAERRRAVRAALARAVNTMAHEINNPLTVIVGHLALLADLADPAVAKRVAPARRAAARIGDFVQRVQRAWSPPAGVVDDRVPPTLEI